MKTKRFLTGLIASFMLLSGPVLAAEGDIGNTDTGKNSENQVSVSTENVVKVEVENDAHVDNEVSVIANTGGNTIGGGEITTGSSILNKHENGNEECCNEGVANTGDKTITTGNATAEATVENVVNTTNVNVEKAEENEEGEGEGVSPATEVAVETTGAAATTPATTEAFGKGAGPGELTGFGAGPLAEAGAEGLLAPIILSSIVTFFMSLKRKKFAL